MKLRFPIVTLAALVLVASSASLNGCSKDKGTNPTPTPTPESFNSGDLVMGVPFTHTFNTAGTYAYRCIHHSSSLTVGMVGTVIVDNSSANLSATVSVATSSFSPPSVTIKTGSTVTWNLSNGTHTVTRP
jgi:plastocyanin